VPYLQVLMPGVHYVVFFPLTGRMGNLDLRII
jgi:hypothetical protein